MQPAWNGGAAHIKARNGAVSPLADWMNLSAVSPQNN